MTPNLCIDKKFGNGDGGPALFDPRFADDILDFATTYVDAGLLLDELV